MFMDTLAKHYRFINSKTDNVIYHYSVEGNLSADEVKAKLEAIKAQVATTNGVYLDTVYWEEVKELDQPS
jgi:hypothetical protein